MRFEFASAGRIIFGDGTLNEAAPLAAIMGSRAFVVTGRNTTRVLSLLDQMESQKIKTTSFSVSREPTTDMVLEGAAKARETGCDLVIGFGGGSVIDTGKAVAALLANPGDILDYLEVIGKARPLAASPAPYIAIPTTSGTGAEVTRNAVLLSPGHKLKVSMRSALMLPRAAVVDPVLTCSLPPDVTASTGLDALTQLIEPFLSNKANPLTDGICREGILRAARSLKRAYEDGYDISARRDMAIASLFGGLALANAGLGAVHGFAGPLGGMFPAPHGAICARLLPYVMEANHLALKARDPESPSLARFDDLAKILIGFASATAQDGVSWIKDLCSFLRVPPLSRFGVKQEHIPDIVEKSENSSSMKSNPITLNREELEGILYYAL